VDPEPFTKREIAAAASPLKLTIDVDNLTIGDQMDLEEATGAGDICRWLVAHAGVEMADLRALKLRELKDLADAIGSQLKEGLTPSKPNGARS
jgi:hypothetical protein